MTNYRSSAAIVDYANQVMAGRGEPSRAHRSDATGQIILAYVDEVWIDSHSRADAPFLVDRIDLGHSDGGQMIARHLKLCHSVLTDSRYRDKSFAILCRTNWIYGVSVDQFGKLLLDSLKRSGHTQAENITKKLQIGTAHSFKGLEADVVILLQATRHRFPLLHPDEQLFGLFGKTNQDILDEERRLFYVAVTRPKDMLFIVTEKDKESDFIVEPSKLGRYRISPDDPRYLQSPVKLEQTVVWVTGQSYKIRERLKAMGYLPSYAPNGTFRGWYAYKCDSGEAYHDKETISRMASEAGLRNIFIDIVSDRSDQIEDIPI